MNKLLVKLHAADVTKERGDRNRKVFLIYLIIYSFAKSAIRDLIICNKV